MSEDTTGVINADQTAQSSSPEPQTTVPKYRLDEEIAEKRRLQEQLLFAQQMLRQAAPPPGRPAAPQVEPEHIRQLKEENPAAYKTFKLQERKLQEQSAATFSLIDRQDRMEYLNEFGQEGAAKLQEVESKLEELRQRGIHHFNRGQIFLHLEGVEAVKQKRTPKQTQQPAPTTAPQVKASATVDAPSSEPKSAGTLSSLGSASTSKTVSLEELERRLENETF